MNEQKPKVIPTKEQMLLSKEKMRTNEEYEKEKLNVTNEIYTTSMNSEVTDSYNKAVEEMMKNSYNDMKSYNDNGYIIKPEFATQNNTVKPYSSEIELKNEQIAENQKKINQYQKNYNDMVNSNMIEHRENTPKAIEKNDNEYFNQLSSPNIDAAFDLIPLPSKGKVYKNVKENIKVAYLTTYDENILTSPNLLESGQFLEILLNRKILEPNLRYRDLLPGDRNAIMIWLRATGYGENYPIVLDDGDGELFETEVNLNDLNMIELAVNPDENGLFDFTLPISKKQLKFKLLTCGDIDDIEEMLESDKEKGVIINNSKSYKLMKMIKSVDGVTDIGFIRRFVDNMLIGDFKSFEKYNDSLESGIDLKISVTTPKRGSIISFLPLNINFFWPE